MPSRTTRTLAAASRLINAVVFDGDDREMLSSRAHREGWKLEWYLDKLFFWQDQHCKASYEWEKSRWTHKQD